MGNETSTIQSLKTVDEWIDVINANINGGVRTGFKSSRLKFDGTDAEVDRSGSSTGLPLQFAEDSLDAANTVIDFSQGAVTASTENTHLAIQGDGYFLVASPDAINTTAGANFGATNAPTAATRLFLTRDGEFHADQNGLLVNNDGYYLVTYTANANGIPWYGTGANGLATSTRAVFDDLDNPTLPAAGGAVKLSDFINNTPSSTTGQFVDFNGGSLGNSSSIAKVQMGEQSLKFSTLGSTVFDFGDLPGSAAFGTTDPNLKLSFSVQADATILSKSLEASNASMTQSVPELSLAQKLFSALTKVLQISQTNTDSLLNLIR